MEKITDLLHDSQDSFLTKFIDMKGVLGDLGEMRNPLKPYVTPVKNILIEKPHDTRKVLSPN